MVSDLSMDVMGSFILFFLSLMIFIFLITRYINSVYNRSVSSNIFIVILRIMTVIFLLFLILDLRFIWKSEYEKPSNLSIVFDMSKSARVNLSTNGVTLMEIKNKIDKWSNLNKVEISYYGLGNELYLFKDLQQDEKGFLFDDLTNFSKFQNSNQLKHHGNILLITDGRATAGQKLNELNFDQFPPIYTIGIGNEEFEDDVLIDTIEILNDNVLDDSLIVNIIIKSRLYGNHKTSINISNSNNNIIYHDFLSLNKGDKIQELSVKLGKLDLSYYNIIKIDAIKGETNLLNNKSPFLIEGMGKIKEILLISGALSSNTSLIKKYLKDALNHNINQYYRIIDNQWNVSPNDIEYTEMELIVLDDFPLYKYDANFYDSIIDSSIFYDIPIILIQGPAMSMESAEIITNKNNFFKVESRSIDTLINIYPYSTLALRSGYEFDLIPPQKNQLKWTSNESPLIKFMDDSIFMANHGGIYLLSSPDLSGLYYNEFLNGEQILDGILRKMFLIAINKERGLLKLSINKPLFNLGEYLTNELLVSNLYQFHDPSFYSFDGLDTLLLDCNNKIIDNKVTCAHYYDKPGEYSLFSSAKLNDGKMIFSNSINVLINQNDIEMENLLLNSQVLTLLSSRTGGMYLPLKSLDSIFNKIDIEPKSMMKTHKLSSLSLQGFWWIMIILLCFEWYIRKQKGLL